MGESSLLCRRGTLWICFAFVLRPWVVPWKCLHFWWVQGCGEVRSERSVCDTDARPLGGYCTDRWHASCCDRASSCYSPVKFSVQLVVERLIFHSFLVLKTPCFFPCLAAQEVEKQCRCGKHTKRMPCHKPYLCETKCAKIRDCQKHQCRRKVSVQRRSCSNVLFR